jgi:imidazolonepropionase-like amidohydrolase
MRTILFLCISLSCLSCKSSAQELPESNLIIYNTNIINSTEDEIKPKVTVFIKEKEIVAVLPYHNSHKSINDTHLINGTDKFLIAGLADMHTHVEHEDDLLPYIANGITTIMNLGSSPAILDIRDKIKRNEILGPDVYAAAFVNSVPPGFTAVTAEEARAKMALIDQMNWDLIKTYGEITKEAFDVMIEEAKNRKIPVVGHGVRATGMKYMLDQKIDAIAHEEEYIYTFTNNTIDYSLIPEAIRLTKENDVYLISTLSTYEVIAHQFGNKAAFDSLLSLSEMKYVRNELKDKWNSSPRYLERTQNIFPRIPFQIEILKQMNASGVKIMPGTDTPFQGMIQGFSLCRGLELLQEAGFSNAEILQSATVFPGEFIKEQIRDSVRIGKVEEGFRANLILLENNPLEDINNLKKISGVIKSGKWYSEEYIAEQMMKLEMKLQK